MTPSQLAVIKRNSESQEGRIPWLYLDTQGHATTGIGHRVASFEAALLLPWQPMLTAAEWVRVTTIRPPYRMSASWYRIDSVARLSNADIDALLDADIAQREAELAREFRNWASWPDGARAAMLDVMYSAGMVRFPHLVAAACRQDWGACAIECHRLGIAEERNAWTAAMFREAEQIAKGAI